MALAGFPSGYRFLPTDKELLNYLFHKLKGGGGSLSQAELAMYIPECNLYGKEEPWQVFNEFGPKYIPFYRVDDLYFFTKLIKKNNSCSNIIRRVGVSGGTWHGEDKGKKIVSEVEIGVEIEGVVKRFKYRNKNNSVQNCGWIMHEFSLPDLNGEIVLCRIRKSEARVEVRVRARASANCDDGESAAKRRKVVESEKLSELGIESSPAESELENAESSIMNNVDDLNEISLLNNPELNNIAAAEFNLDMELEYFNNSEIGSSDKSETKKITTNSENIESTDVEIMKKNNINGENADGVIINSDDYTEFNEDEFVASLFV